MTHVAIVDDEATVREQIHSYLLRYGEAHGLEFQISEFCNGFDFITDYKPVYDVVFMDIDMPYKNGMSIAKEMRKTDATTILVFITNLIQYAVEGYGVSASDYIVKPLLFERFAVHLEKLLALTERRARHHLEITVNKTRMSINAEDIWYLEVMDHMVIYHTASGNYETWDTLSRAEKALQALPFARCNSCYLVNLRHVKGITGDQVRVGNDRLKISRNKRKDFLDKLAEAI